MRYSTFFKFIAVVLCAASLLGMVSSAAGIFFLTELGGKSVEEQYADRLRSQALGYSLKAAEIYASQELGGAPRNLLNYHYGNDWETRYFSWTKAGYIIRDAEGNVLQEKPIPDDSWGRAYEFEFAAVGPYMKVERYEEKEMDTLRPLRLDETRRLANTGIFVAKRYGRRCSYAYCSTSRNRHRPCRPLNRRYETPHPNPR